MKPHLAFINQTIAKKYAAEKALNPLGHYERYKLMAINAQTKGISNQQIIEELEAEKARILAHEPDVEGDKLASDGIRDAKISCLSAIDKLIEKLK